MSETEHGVGAGEPDLDATREELLAEIRRTIVGRRQMVESFQQSARNFCDQRADNVQARYFEHQAALNARVVEKYESWVTMVEEDASLRARLRDAEAAIESIGRIIAQDGRRFPVTATLSIGEVLTEYRVARGQGRSEPWWCGPWSVERGSHGAWWRCAEHRGTFGGTPDEHAAIFAPGRHDRCTKAAPQAVSSNAATQPPSESLENT